MLQLSVIILHSCNKPLLFILLSCTLVANFVLYNGWGYAEMDKGSVVLLKTAKFEEISSD